MRNALLRTERLRRGWTQQQLADFAGISLSTVERAEKGESIRVDCIQRLCECLSKSIISKFRGEKKRASVRMRVGLAEKGAWRKGRHNLMHAGREASTSMRITGLFFSLIGLSSPGPLF